MKFIGSLLLHLGIGFVLTAFLPWWTVVIAAFLVAFFLRIDSWKSFLAGFLAMTILWAGTALFLDVQNSEILSSKVAQLFQLPNSKMLVYITGIIGGLLGGFGALTGNLLKSAISPEQKRYGTRKRRNRYNLPLEENNI